MALACPKPSKPSGKCEVRCEALAELSVHPRPHVECEIERGRTIEFPFDLELSVDKRCRIKHVKTCHSKDGCKVKIFFKGEIEVDCNAKASHGSCEPHKRLAKVHVNVPTSVQAKVLKVCNKDRENSSRRGIPAPH